MVINLPILKDHSWRGVTFAMKNMYGVVERPQDLHAGGCNPGVADLNCIPAIREKVRLTIGDAMSSVYEGGPGFHPEHLWYPNALIVGEDRVALDQTAWRCWRASAPRSGLPTFEAAGRRRAILPRPPMRRTVWAPTIRNASIWWRFECGGSTMSRRASDTNKTPPDCGRSARADAARGDAATAARGRRGGRRSGRGCVAQRTQFAADPGAGGAGTTRSSRCGGPAMAGADRSAKRRAARRWLRRRSRILAGCGGSSGGRMWW